MFDERELSSDDRKLEASLARLRPREPAMSATAIAFEAGRRAHAFNLTIWRAVAAVLAVAVILSGLLRPSPRTTERIVYIPSIAPATAVRPVFATVEPTAAPDPRSYSRLRNDVIDYGVDALPPSPHTGSRNEEILRLGSSRTPSGDSL